MSIAFFFVHFWHFFYAGSPWYTAAIWGNVFVVFVAAPLGYLWSKTKYWPLHPLKIGINHLHTKLDGHITEFKKHRAESDAHNDHQSKMIEEMHHLAHTGEQHPRVIARKENGESLTPTKKTVL